MSTLWEDVDLLVADLTYLSRIAATSPSTADFIRIDFPQIVFTETTRHQNKSFLYTGKSSTIVQNKWCFS